jgi:hypothetical protein
VRDENHGVPAAAVYLFSGEHLLQRRLCTPSAIEGDRAIIDLRLSRDITWYTAPGN